jgi:hypothetical protein
MLYVYTIDPSKVSQARYLHFRLVRVDSELADCRIRYEEKGEVRKAADYYRKAAEFAERGDGFGESPGEFFRKKALELEEKKGV